MSVLAIVPARSGSKSVPHKNLLSFRGRPLLVHSVDHARAARNVDRVLVSTDSPRYRELALAAGAEAPFLRPPALAEDTSTDFDVFEHALGWLDREEGYRPDLVVHLRPTYPTRRVADVEQAVEMLLAHPDADSVRSVTRAPHTPYKMWRLQEGGTLAPLLESKQSKLEEPWNLPRQLLPTVYLQNAAVDVVRASVILEQRSMTGRKVLAYVMEEIRDVDEWTDLAAAEAAAPDEPMPTGRTFVFDMDGVIATLVPDGNYAEAEPYAPGIALVNRLYEAGNRIVVHTARGSLTGRDWTKVTEGQLLRWKVLHHDLVFGKPAADYYVDDRMISLAALQSWLGFPVDRPRRKSA